MATTTTTTGTAAATATAATAATAPATIQRHHYRCDSCCAARCGCSTSASVTVMDAESGLELAAARLVDDKTIPQGTIDYKEVDPISPGPPGYPPRGNGFKTKEVAMLVTAGGQDHSLLVATHPSISPNPPRPPPYLPSISPRWLATRGSTSPARASRG